ncbi:MAG TPA: AMP-binding protein [Gammaproteobacteria bacterium]|jgi:acyl-coenzyme A synthetase/AMP-(fatty) acid ligase|nr:AMP-binding protein [Gammaproteobacteria bacterium]
MPKPTPPEPDETYPLLQGHGANPAAWRAGRAIGVEALIAEAGAWSARLPDRDYILNLCSDRYAFTVGFLAALANGQTTLLPPDGRPATLQALAARYGSVGVFNDAPPPLALPHTCWQEDAGGAGAAVPAAIPGERVAAIVHTSGSSGEPQPHLKTWGMLARRARAVGRRLGLETPQALKLVATVPAQHMYGLENSVMLALQCGAAVCASRPFFAADVAAALAEGEADNLLVTTPIHLKALYTAPADYRRVRLALSSTAPLAAAAANAAEACLGAPVLEIYGSSETGVAAMRRTAAGEAWRPVDGVRIAAAADGALVEDVATGVTVRLEDDISVAADGSFVLGARLGDVVKVGGKRGSLAALTAALLDIPGVEDGVFLAPAADGAAARLVAFVVAPALDEAALLAALRERVDAVFLPRPLVKVRALPRNATGKLPRAALDRLLCELPAAAAD